MPDKPSYLGLLNAVALAESRAHQYLNAWIAVTPSDEVRCVLATVSAREGEHGMSFAKRINELGYSVLDRPDPSFAEKMEIAGSDRSDLEKMECLRLGRAADDEPDVFDNFFRDHSIDVRTGELLGRYIAEERDSERLLRQCHEQLRAAAVAGNGRPSTAGYNESDGARLARVEHKVDDLCAAIEQLRDLVADGSGRKPAKR